MLSRKPGQIHLWARQATQPAHHHAREVQFHQVLRLKMGFGPPNLEWRLSL